MKKIAVVILIVCLIISCGKKEKGVMTIENKSTYPVEIEFAQNYKSQTFNLAPLESKNCEWEHYHHCLVKSPSLNIIHTEEVDSHFIISNKKTSVHYRVINELPKSIDVNSGTMDISIRLIDNGQNLLLKNGIYAEHIDIDPAKPYTDITLFRPITEKNIFISCLNKDKNEAKFDFKYENETLSKTYKVIENTNGLYFQKISDDKKELVISRIKINIVDVKSEYIDTNGNKQIVVTPTVFINMD